MAKHKTKIVCTIGPATWEPETLKKLAELGMTVARVNASFADAAEIKRVTHLIRETTPDVMVLLDLKGHKIRISDFPEPKEIHAGQDYIFNTDPTSQDVVVSYEDLHKDIKPGARLLIDDGKLHFEVSRVEGTQIICKALNSGMMKRLKTVNVPGTYLSFDPLTEKDKADIEAGIEVGVDMIAGSFVRDANDVQAITDRIQNTDIAIVAKIEDPHGVKNFDEILQHVDGIMVARGDMGVEIPYEQVPVLQKEFIKKCNRAGKPVIVATHMLESMTSSPSATRAEVSDVANAVFDGTDAIMTSAETSTGTYPIDAISTMSNILNYIEPLIKPHVYEHDIDEVIKYHTESDSLTSIAIAISKSTAEACENLPIKAVLVVSKGGFTARMIARHKIAQPIYTYVTKEIYAKQLALSRGIKSFVLEETLDDRDMAITQVIEKAKRDGVVESGDLVAIVIGSQLFSGIYASMLEIQKVG